MYFYWTRDFVNKTLGLTRRQSYRLVHATSSGRIRSDAVLSILNRSRVGIDEPLTVLPDAILTPDEAAAHFLVSSAELRRWAKRKRRVAPHFQINRCILRFPSGLLGKWLKENSK